MVGFASEHRKIKCFDGFDTSKSYLEYFMPCLSKKFILRERPFDIWRGAIYFQKILSKVLTLNKYSLTVQNQISKNISSEVVKNYCATLELTKP